MLGLSNERDAKARCRFLQHALGSIAPAQDHFDRPGGRYMRNDAGLQRAGKLIQTLQIGRIRQGQVQAPSVSLKREKLVTDHQINRDLIEESVIDR